MVFTQRKNLPAYSVKLALSGRHPYRKEPEFQYPDSTAVVVVNARSWNDAERQACKPSIIGEFLTWSIWVISITRLEKRTG